MKDMLDRYEEFNKRRLDIIKVIEKRGGTHTFEDGTTMTAEQLKKYYQQNIELQKEYIRKFNPDYV